jgi:hypothetical protein
MSSKFRIKVAVSGIETVRPEVFASKQEAENFMKKKTNPVILNQMVKNNLVQFYEEKQQCQI